MLRPVLSIHGHNHYIGFYYSFAERAHGQEVMIRELLWPEDQIDHIARHKISPDEFEEVCFGRSLVFRAKSEGTNPVYHVLGETYAGRHLLCIVISFRDGKGYPVTARNMTDREKRRYRQWKRR